MMNILHRPSSHRWLIAGALLAAAALAQVVERHDDDAPTGAPDDLVQLVPQRFGGWRVDADAILRPLSAAAAVQASVAYTQTLERVYIGPENRRIMLSIAYSARQRGDGLQAHRPEYCYRAQGFAVRPAGNRDLATAHVVLRLQRLQTQRPGRTEPVSYWLTVGDQAVLPGWSRKIAQLRQALSGGPSDGVLVRVSSINDAPAAAFAVHDRFIADLMQALPVSGRRRLAGSSGRGADT